MPVKVGAWIPPRMAQPRSDPRQPWPTRLSLTSRQVRLSATRAPVPDMDPLDTDSSATTAARESGLADVAMWIMTTSDQVARERRQHVLDEQPNDGYLRVNAALMSVQQMLCRHILKIFL